MMSFCHFSGVAKYLLSCRETSFEVKHVLLTDFKNCSTKSSKFNVIDTKYETCSSEGFFLCGCSKTFF